MDYLFAPERHDAEGFVLRSYDVGDGPLLAEAVNQSYEHLRPWIPWAKPSQSVEEAFVKGEFVPTDFKMGGNAGNAYAVGGRWPDDVRSIVPGDGFWRDLRRLDSGHKWQTVARLPWRYDDQWKLELDAWLPGRALVIDHPLDVSPHATSWEKISIRSPGPPRRVPSLVKNGHQLLDQLDAVAAFPSGGVVMAGEAGKDDFLRVLTWTPGAKAPSVHDVHLAHFWVATMLASSLDDITIVGDDPGRARGFRGKNGNWTELDLPRWGDSVRSYAREPRGKEWVVPHRADQHSGRTGLSVWSREPQSEWHRVELPLPQVAEGTFDAFYGFRMPVGKVWAPADDNVWILVRSADKCSRVTNFVFHNARPKSTCQMKPWDSSSCKPIAAHRVRTTRCPNW